MQSETFFFDTVVISFILWFSLIKRKPSDELVNYHNNNATMTSTQEYARPWDKTTSLDPEYENNPESPCYYSHGRDCSKIKYAGVDSKGRGPLGMSIGVVISSCRTSLRCQRLRCVKYGRLQNEKFQGKYNKANRYVSGSSRAIIVQILAHKWHEYSMFHFLFTSFIEHYFLKQVTYQLRIL